MVMQHYSIITAVMELSSDKSDTVTAGFLSSLLGDGCECHGYNIAIIGHSLGGSVAALLGIKVSFFIYNIQRIYLKSLDNVDLSYLVIKLKGVLLDVSLKYGYMPLRN
jgi:hypothetical protein